MSMKALTLLLLAASTHCMAQTKSDVPGTYELMVCKSSCSFENPQTAIARGVVVFFQSPLSKTDAEKLDPHHFPEWNEIIRACFAGETSSGDAKSFAFGQGTGTTAW